MIRSERPNLILPRIFRDPEGSIEILADSQRTNPNVFLPPRLTRTAEEIIIPLTLRSATKNSPTDNPPDTRTCQSVRHSLNRLFLQLPLKRRTMKPASQPTNQHQDLPHSLFTHTSSRRRLANSRRVGGRASRFICPF